MTRSSVRSEMGLGRKLRGRVTAKAIKEVKEFWHAVMVNG